MQECFRNAVIGILLCCMMLSAAVADIGGDDPAFFYDTALKNVELDRYADAEDYFAKAGSYKDAALWKRYCEAIQKTNGDAAIADLQRAQTLFDGLLNVSIEHDKWQPAVWKKYGQALLNEKKGFLDSAMKTYQELGDFQDSVDRYWLLNDQRNGTSGRSTYEGWLVTSKYAVIYMGPGSNYPEGETSDAWEKERQSSKKVKVSVLEKTGYWYLIEYSVDGLLTRGYVAQNRLVDVQVGVPETTEKGVLKIGGGKPLYAGPGEEYKVRLNMIPAGSTLRIFDDEEDGYQLVEYEDAKGICYRGWMEK